ncbi:MAG: galactokinase family protein, partial [Chloroflexota bacterium]
MNAAGVRVLEERARHAGWRAFGTGWQPTRIAIAPGRVELIGNHTDYNGGPVLCAAIDRWILVLADDDLATEEIRLIGADVSRDEGRCINPRTSDDWHAATGTHDVADYVQGAVAAIGTRPGMTVRSGTR